MGEFGFLGDGAWKHEDDDDEQQQQQEVGGRGKRRSNKKQKRRRRGQEQDEEVRSVEDADMKPPPPPPPAPAQLPPAPAQLPRPASNAPHSMAKSCVYYQRGRRVRTDTPVNLSPLALGCLWRLPADCAAHLTRPFCCLPLPLPLPCPARARAKGYCKFSNRCRYQHIPEEFNTVQRPKPLLNDDDHPYGHSAAFALPAGQMVPVAALLAFEQQRALEREREQAARVERLERELAAMRQVVQQQSVHIEVAQRQQQQGGQHLLFQRKNDNKSRNAAKKFKRNQRAQAQWTEQDQHAEGAAAAAAPEETQFSFEQRGMDRSPWPQRRAEYNDAADAFASPQALLPTPRRQALLPTPSAAAYSNGNGHSHSHAAAAASSSGVNGSAAPQLRVRTKLSGQKRAHDRDDDDDANDNSTSVEVFSRMPLQLSQLSQQGTARRLPPVPTHTQQAEQTNSAFAAAAAATGAPSVFAFDDARPMDLKTEAGAESVGDVMSEGPAASTRSTRSRARAQR